MMKTFVIETLLAVGGFALSDLVMKALIGQQPVRLGRGMQPCEDTLTLTLPDRIPTRRAEDPSGTHGCPPDSRVTVATARRLARDYTPGSGGRMDWALAPARGRRGALAAHTPDKPGDVVRPRRQRFSWTTDTCKVVKIITCPVSSITEISLQCLKERRKL